MENIIPLSQLKKGEIAQVFDIQSQATENKSSLSTSELERRLLEMGFIEGTEVSIQHTGPIGRDPIAVLIRSSSLVALRKQEADSILVRKS